MLSKFEKSILNIARKYKFIGIDIEDLVQEGWLAVLEIQDRLINMKDEDAKAFIVPFVRRAMRDFCSSNQRIVKIIKTKGETKAVNNILSYASSSEKLKNDVILKMVDDLNIKERDIVAASDFVFGNDSPVTADGKVSFSYGERDLPEFSTLSFISDRVIHLSALEESVSLLDERERGIITLRWLSDKKTPLREIADKFNVSVSGAAYVESVAISSIKKSIDAYIAA